MQLRRIATKHQLNLVLGLELSKQVAKVADAGANGHGFAHNEGAMQFGETGEQTRDSNFEVRAKISRRCDCRAGARGEVDGAKIGDRNFNLCHDSEDDVFHVYRRGGIGDDSIRHHSCGADAGIFSRGRAQDAVGTDFFPTPQDTAGHTYPSAEGMYEQRSDDGGRCQKPGKRFRGIESEQLRGGDEAGDHATEPARTQSNPIGLKRGFSLFDRWWRFRVAGFNERAHAPFYVCLRGEVRLSLVYVLPRSGFPSR
jgi:hypothetical protein